MAELELLMRRPMQGKQKYFPPLVSQLASTISEKLRKSLIAMVPLGVLIYGGTGVISFLYGANYLDYAILGHTSKHGHHLGIIMVEAGVIITVAGTMTAIFYAFLLRGR